MRKRYGIAAVAIVCAAVLLYALDGPLWRFTAPRGIDPEIADAIARLHSWRGSTRASAAIELGIRRENAAPAVPYLIDHLKDRGYTLGWMEGFRSSLSFHNSIDTVGRRATEALLAIGRPAVPELAAAIRDQREDVRRSVCYLLGEIGGPASAAALHAVAQTDASALVRAEAVHSLARMRDPATLQSLVRQLSDANPLLRERAALDLSDSGDPAAVDPLLNALSDPERRVRDMAGIALQRMTRQSFGTDAAAWRQYFARRKQF